MPIKIFFVSLLLSGSVLAAQECVWHYKNAEIINIGDNVFSIGKYECVMGDSNAYTYTAYVTKSNGDKFEIMPQGKYQKIELLDTRGSGLNAVYLGNHSTSNIASLIKVYDKDWNKVITIYKPINEYQANNRQGSEVDVVGFYGEDDSIYIETIRSVGGQCNACQQSVVDTYKVVGNELIVINERMFDIGNYERYGND